MPTKPKITIPATPNPRSGIVVVKGIAYAAYYVDGKRRRKAIAATPCFDEILTKRRDTFYATLKRQGATVAVRKPKPPNRAAKAEANPDRYIRRREPWVVTIGGKVIAEVGSKKEAKEARDRYLGIA